MAMRILFVDDCPDTLKLLPDLSTEDTVIDTCHSAREARERLAPGHGYRAAVIDWVLGECSGLDLAKWARSHSDNLPVVMVSAASAERFDELAAACRATSNMEARRKPYDIDEVLALCRRMAGLPPLPPARAGC